MTFDELDPDLVVTDISLPGMSGLELTKHLHTLKPELAILVISRHDETLYAERAIRAGARGYIMKLEADEVIVRAVRRVLRGGIYVSDQVSGRLLLSVAGGRESIPLSPLEILSDRELEVLEHIGHARSTREIAERLYLSEKTVESYRGRIKEKLHLNSPPELMKYAVRWVEGEESG